MLELVEEALDLITPFVFGFVVRDWVASVALCWNDGLDVGAGDLFANGVSVVPLCRRGAPRSGRRSSRTTARSLEYHAFVRASGRSLAVGLSHRTGHGTWL